MYEMQETRLEMGSGKGGGGGGGGGGGEAPTEGPAPPGQSAEEVLGEGDNFEPTEIDKILGTAEIDANPGGRVVGKGKLAENLSEQDQATIRSYTGGMTTRTDVAPVTAEELNSILRNPAAASQRMQQAAKIHKKDLNTSLSKVKSYKGETYRVISDPKGGVAGKYTPGSIVKQNDFISTSRATNASSFPYAKVSNMTRFKIKSKTGKPIEKIAHHRGEQEVLFRSGTSFRVTGKKWNQPRQSWDITLEEI